MTYVLVRSQEDQISKYYARKLAGFPSQDVKFIDQFFRKSYVVGVAGNIIDTLRSRPASRRLRWPIGRRTPDGLIGSVVTRNQVMHGGLDEEQTRALQMNVFEREGRLMGMRIVDSANELWGGRLPYNPRQGWAPSGERIL